MSCSAFQSVDLRIKTKQITHMSQLWSADNKCQTSSPSPLNHLWLCAPSLVCPPPPSRGSPPWCAADPRGLCVDVLVCSGQSCCRAPARSKRQTLCYRIPGTLRPGSLAWQELYENVWEKKEFLILLETKQCIHVDPRFSSLFCCAATFMWKTEHICIVGFFAAGSRRI